MPRDKHGNIADIIVDPTSRNSRMNIGSLYDHFYGALSRDNRKVMIERLGLIDQPTSVEQIASVPTKLFNEVYEWLMGLYHIVNTKQGEFFSNLPLDKKHQHIADIINDMMYFYVPADNATDPSEVVRLTAKDYPTLRDTVTYRGDSGILRETKSAVRIAPVPYMLLDKIADTWSSVSSGKLQVFGVLSVMTKADKFSYPYRNTPVRTIGETETRIYAGYCGREAIAEMIDRSNNPQSTRNMVWNILTADQPSNLERAVDREFIPLGNTRPLQLVRHIMACSGFKMKYTPPVLD